MVVAMQQPASTASRTGGRALDRRPPQRRPGSRGRDLDEVERRVALEVADDGAEIAVCRVDRDQHLGHPGDPIRASLVGLRRMAPVDVGHEDRRRADLVAVIVGRDHRWHRDVGIGQPSQDGGLAARGIPRVGDLPARPQPSLEHEAPGRAARPDQVDAVDGRGHPAVHAPRAGDAPAGTGSAFDPPTGRAIDGRVPGRPDHAAILDAAGAPDAIILVATHGGPPWTGRSRS